MSLPVSLPVSSPVPKLRWRKVEGLLPAKAGRSAQSPTLTLPDVSFDDEGLYECEAYNSEGSDTYQGRINVQGTPRVPPRSTQGGGGPGWTAEGRWMVHVEGGGVQIPAAVRPDEGDCRQVCRAREMNG